MFTSPRTIKTLDSPDQPITFVFMEDGNVVANDELALPGWIKVHVNDMPQEDGNITVSNGDTLQIFVKASPAPGMHRTAYLSFAHKQFVLDVTTQTPSPPPPSPPAPSPPPDEVILGEIEHHQPRVCNAAEMYKMANLFAPNRSSLPTNAWCSRSMPSGVPYEASLCSSKVGRDILILVDASHGVGRDTFYGPMIDMLHDMYCSIEGTGSQVGVLLLPGSGNPYVCDAYSSYIPLAQYTSDDFHARLEQMRNDEGACCGNSVPLAQGLQAAAGLFHDFGVFAESDRSVIFLTGSHPSTPVEAESCGSVSLDVFRNQTRDHPFNTLSSGEELTACQYRLRNVQVAAADLKLKGTRVSVVTVPGAHGTPPSSAYYSGSPWPSRCDASGACEFEAPYGGDRGGWGAWYDVNGTLTRDYDVGGALSCTMNMQPRAPIVSKPVVMNVFRVNEWDARFYTELLGLAMCPMPDCVHKELVNFTQVEWCEGDSSNEWTNTKTCIREHTYAACDHYIARTERCYGEATSDDFVVGTIGSRSALRVNIHCEQRCDGERTTEDTVSIRVVCSEYDMCESERFVAKDAYPAKTTDADPAKTTDADPAKTTDAYPAKTTDAYPAKTHAPANAYPTHAYPTNPA